MQAILEILNRFITLLLLGVSISLALPAPVNASFAGSNGKILYAKYIPQIETDGTYQQTDGVLYTANSDGTNETALGAVPSYTDASFSPDGSHIVYSETTPSDSNKSDFIVSSLDGSNKQTVYSGYFISEPKFVSNGTSISFTQCQPSGGCNYTNKVNIDGTGLKTLVNNGYGQLSPNGDAYVYLPTNGTSEVQYTSGLDGTTAKASQPPVSIYSTASSCMWTCLTSEVWAPDNVRIAFWKETSIDTSSLVILNTQTRQADEYSFTGRPNSLVWSPDGSSLLFTGDTSTTKPYYGFPYSPKLTRFDMSSHQFTTLPTHNPYRILDWQSVGNSNTTIIPTPQPTMPVTAPSTVNVYRFWSPLLRHHMLTSDAYEAEYIRTHYPASIWTYEGVAFKVKSLNNCQAGENVFRFYSEVLKTHLYTTDEYEKSQLIAKYPPSVWRYEGVAYCADKNLAVGKKPVYRFYSEVLKSHLFTTDEYEKQSIIQNYPPSVWRYEGIAYYAS